MIYNCSRRAWIIWQDWKLWVNTGSWLSRYKLVVMILFPRANHLPLFQHGRCPSHSETFQNHALACFFLLTCIYYLHAFHIMFTIPISCLLPHAQQSHSMPIPHYLHMAHHMHSMLVLHYLHTHTICFPYFDHAFPSI